MAVLVSPRFPLTESVPMELPGASVPPLIVAGAVAPVGQRQPVRERRGGCPFSPTRAGRAGGVASITGVRASRRYGRVANIGVGATTISAGTLQIGNGGTAGSIAGNVVDNGTLV